MVLPCASKGSLGCVRFLLFRNQNLNKLHLAQIDVLLLSDPKVKAIFMNDIGN